MYRRAFSFAVALALFAPDASAWGLQTHLLFAQWVLLALPFADKELRAAARRLPALVLAGACLPDLALAGKALGTPAFARSHRWSTLRRLSAAPRDDADRALVVGYASHLLSDVVAHNAFVPEHEARIARVRHVTHALAEWAMDEHIRGEILASPREVLEAQRPTVIDFVARAFRCDHGLAQKATGLLGRADGALRASRIPAVCNGVLRLLDASFSLRFDAYLRDALATLQGLEIALGGGMQDWVSLDPDGAPVHRHPLFLEW